MAERVSRSVRRLDDIQMRVQRALALVEDVINLRGCADVRVTARISRIANNEIAQPTSTKFLRRSRRI